MAAGFTFPCEQFVDTAALQWDRGPSTETAVARNFLCMNQAGGVTQFIDFNFNSIVKTPDGKVIGGNEDGLYEVTGNVDSRGCPVNCWCSFGFDAGQDIRLGELIVSGILDGYLQCTVQFDEQTDNEKLFLVIPKIPGQVGESKSVKQIGTVGRQGRVLLLTIDGTLAGNWAINRIEGYVYILGHRYSQRS